MACWVASRTLWSTSCVIKKLTERLKKRLSNDIHRLAFFGYFQVKLEFGVLVLGRERKSEAIKKEQVKRYNRNKKLKLHVHVTKGSGIQSVRSLMIGGELSCQSPQSMFPFQVNCSIWELTRANLLNSLGQNGRALSTASTVKFLHNSVNSCTA